MLKFCFDDKLKKLTWFCVMFLNTEPNIVIVFTSASIFISLIFSNMHSDIVIFVS